MTGDQDSREQWCRIKLKEKHIYTELFQTCLTAILHYSQPQWRQKREIPLLVILVQQNRAKFHKNCGVNGKSTKFGTMIVYDKVKNIGYGPHRDLSHNSKYSMFNFLHQDSVMEKRLSQTIPN